MKDGPRRRARRRLGLASLAAGTALATLLLGLLVHPLFGAGHAPSALLARHAGARGALLAVAALALARWGATPWRARILAGCGWCLGGGLAGAAIAVLVDAAWLRAWDVALFGAGLFMVGAWLAAGAAPPRAARGLDADGASWAARRRASRKRGLKTT